MASRIRHAISRLLLVGSTSCISLFSFSSVAADDTDILDTLPAILGVVSAIQACSDGVYANCTTSVGCRAIDGIFENGQCRAKPIGQSLAEQFAGKWSGETSLQNGSFFNYLSFDASSLARLGSGPDYLLSGLSHPTSSLTGLNPNPVLVSYDSSNDDWFMLDFWGTDIKKISAIEIAQTSANQFDGCEFILNYPDFTYLDGVCNPIRLRRVGSIPGFIRTLSNIVSDGAAYVAALFGSAQGGGVAKHIADNRPSINRIPNLLSLKTVDKTPIEITSPQNLSATNAAIISVQGNVEETINLDRVTVNGVQVTPAAGSFSRDITTDEGVNTVTAIADYGRRIYTAQLAFEVDNVRPSVVSAASTSSTEVLLQFNEAMGDAAISDTAHFNIVRLDNDSSLPVTLAEFTDDTHTAVRLQTGLQGNTEYIITAINVRDVAGNPISEPQPEVEASLSSATFVGTPPTGNEVVDTDTDGLLDHIEMAGWPVIVTRTDGSTETIIVNSDPFSVDTDNDGVSDTEERHGGMDPRNSDTDGDTLSDDDEWNRIYSDPTRQDTDGDGIQDGFEFLFFKTSPILADTDGDQIDDPTELTAGNRSPLVADLPSPDISIGNVNLQLDTRFTFTDEEGNERTDNKTVESTLSQGEDATYSSSNEASTVNTLKFSEDISTTISYEVEAEAGITGGVSSTVSGSVTTAFGSEQGSEKGHTSTFGEESSRNSEETYHDSLSSSLSKSASETVTREVLGASMKVDLTIANAGDIPFTVNNLELTAQAQDPRNRRQLIPIASLTPENESLGAVNIGVLGDPSRGPFVFATGVEEVFPQEIEELMKNPRGLVVQLANYDIVDQEGNNFAYSSQEVLDRTVGITFDSGDGRNESYRVATASEHDPDTGQPLGITMARALEIAGFNRFATVRDGGNGVVETLADGDDAQSHALLSDIEPLTTFITVGANEALDTVILGGDDVIVEADYETELYSESAVIIDGGNGINDTEAPDEGSPIPGNDDERRSTYLSSVQPGQVLVGPGVNDLIDTIPNQDLTGTPTPGGDDILVPPGKARRVLMRFRDTEASDDELKFWVLYSAKQVQGVDLDDLRLRSGEQYDFAYIQDVDQDNVWAREEYLHGSSDNKVNTDGCDLVPAPDPCDTLTDFFEIHTGWRVQLHSSLQGYRVYPNPNQGDSDRDGLSDDIEFACGLDPRLRDTDYDGLSDREELLGLQFIDGVYVPMTSIDPDDIDPDVVISVYSGPQPTSLPESLSTSPNYVDHPLNAACDAAILADANTPPGFVSGYATNPLDADTDGDFINDLEELQLGLHPSDSSDAGSVLDDDGDGLPNSVERAGWTIFVDGIAVRVGYSKPDKIDSDGDTLPDLLEYFLGSDPSRIDTDGDGISDTNEYKNDGKVCVGGPGAPCTRFVDLGSNGYARFVQECTAADACSIAGIENDLAGAAASQIGTNLNHTDTDGDGHIDGDELVAGQRHQFRTNPLSPVLYTPYADVTNPLLQDSDNDGISDGSEVYWYGSNAASPWTDTDDGLNDGQELAVGRNPVVNDRRIAVGLAPGEYNVNLLQGWIDTANHWNGSSRCSQRANLNGASGANQAFEYGYTNLDDCDPIPSVIITQGSSRYLGFSVSAPWGFPVEVCTISNVTDLTLTYSNTAVHGAEMEGNNGNMHVCQPSVINVRRDYIIRHHDDSAVPTPPLINNLPAQ